jgi:hypothetical protein
MIIFIRKALDHFKEEAENTFLFTSVGLKLLFSLNPEKTFAALALTLDFDRFLKLKN